MTIAAAAVSGGLEVTSSVDDDTIEAHVAAGLELAGKLRVPSYRYT